MRIIKQYFNYLYHLWILQDVFNVNVQYTQYNQIGEILNMGYGNRVKLIWKTREYFVVTANF